MRSLDAFCIEAARIPEPELPRMSSSHGPACPCQGTRCDTRRTTQGTRHGEPPLRGPGHRVRGPFPVIHPQAATARRRERRPRIHRRRRLCGRRVHERKSCDVEKSVDSASGSVDNCRAAVGEAVESPESRGSYALHAHRPASNPPQRVNTPDSLGNWDAGSYPQVPQGLLTLQPLKEKGK